MLDKKLRHIRSGIIFTIFYCQNLLSCVNCNISFLFLADMSCAFLRFSAVLAHLAKTADAPLHTFTVMSGYFSHCYLPINLKQQGQHIFTQRTAAHRCFLFFFPILKLFLSFIFGHLDHINMPKCFVFLAH